MHEGAEYSTLAEDINQTIDEIVPKKKNMFKNGRSISEETKNEETVCMSNEEMSLAKANKTRKRGKSGTRE